MKYRILLLALASTGVSSAATISYEVNFGSSAIGTPQFSVNLPKFDPTILGYTLTEVTIRLDSSTSSNILLFDNEAASPGSVTLNVGTTVTATAPLITAVVATPVQTGTGTVAADNDGAADYTGTDSFSVAGGSGSAFDTKTSTSGATLAVFTAGAPGETFATTIDNSIFTGTSTSGIFGPTLPTAGNFDGKVTVTYTYTVPETSSALLGGLGMLALLRRRRSR